MTAPTIWPSERARDTALKNLRDAAHTLTHTECRLRARLRSADIRGISAAQTGIDAVRELYGAVVNTTAAMGAWQRGHRQRRMRDKQRSDSDIMIRNALGVAAQLGARLTRSRYSTEQFIRASDRNRRLLFRSIDEVRALTQAWTVVQAIGADRVAPAQVEHEQADLLAG